MLADYINTARETEIVIKRIKEGNYQFGSKFVKIKNIKNKLAVLTGGGYTSIEEYLINIKEKEISKQA
jgi:hypothetical protein